jgi:hypothetical protein
MEHTSKSEYRKETYPEQGAAFRASISFPPDLDETLEEVSQQNKVSLAWVVRDAVERYVADGAEDGRGGRLPHDSAQRGAHRIDR